MTTLSASDLARLLDSLAQDRHVLITEDERCVVVSELQVVAAQQISRVCALLGWRYRVEDQASNDFTPEELCDAFAPFRLTFDKALPANDGALYLLSTSGFNQWLACGHPATHWRLATLGENLSTQARIYTDWNASAPFTPSPATRSPRALVRETAASRQVCNDIRPWLLADTATVNFADPLHLLWVTKAFGYLSQSLANEVVDAGELLFFGPPPLCLPPAPGTTDELVFQQLQDAVYWVYELNREAELRHRLLATEIARMGRGDVDVESHFRAYLRSALEGAKASYQVYLGETTTDILNALNDLRRHATEETAKAMDSTQKASGSMAVTLGIGITIYATHVGAAVPPWIVTLVIIGTWVYTALVVWSNWRFIRLERHQQQVWHPRLYRFLPQSEYEAMIQRPSRRSARIYARTSLLGLIAVAVIGVVIIAASFLNDPPAADKEPPTEVHRPDNTTPEAQTPKEANRHGLLWSGRRGN